MIKVSNNNTLSFVLANVFLATCFLVPIGESVADVGDEVMADFAELGKSGSQDWFDLAAKARSAGNFPVAKHALKQPGALKFSPVRLGLEKARLRIAADEPAAATAELQGVVDAGFAAVGILLNDPVINSLAGNADYDALISKMSVQAYPCRYQAGFSDFDFWLGEWEVAVADGRVRQFFEQSNDGGETWVPWFEGFYSRKD